ncbi:hypothetical protein PXK01_13900 [Phaeobacter sp. PT47_59]|uniref:hypothetical protein n=1 Tax=Phaeobacter sp. PT47_59 TaxID=3029979 RepID=UPI00238033D0|nr:hypothetical protein [Phaeobacter sp. PT47_59]MDE4175252.1 hypothetical protein [Phaeobacter sp. PT47_59]
MEHNLDFGAEAQANHSLAILRAMECDDAVEPGARFAPGVFLSVDPESDTTAQLVSRPGMLADIRFTTSRPGRWLSLNIELGAFDLSARDVIGFMCKSRAEDTITFRACLRSGTEGGFQDAFFGKRVISYDAPSTHADLIKLDEREDIPATAPWRELVVFFPSDLRQLSLIDLSLFGV